MKKSIVFLFYFLVSISCFGEENYIDTSEVRKYVINEVKKDGHLCPGNLMLINEGCNIELPLLQKRVDLYLKLQKEYNKCTNETNKIIFIQNNKDNFSSIMVKIDNIDKANRLFANENVVHCIEAFRARCIANIGQYCLDNYEDAFYESFNKIFNKVNSGKKVYWGELIKVGKYWGIPEDKMTEIVNKSGLYRSKKGLIIYR